MRKLKSGRITLEDKGRSALETMLHSLRESEGNIKITPSRLTSWILERFQATAFEKEKRSIIESHFNSRGYLRDALKGVKTEDELTAALQTVMQRMKPTRRRKLISNDSK